MEGGWNFPQLCIMRKGRMKKEEMGWLLEKSGIGEEVRNVWFYVSVPRFLQYLRVIDEVNKPISFSSNIFYFPVRIGWKVKLWVQNILKACLTYQSKKYILTI